MKKRNLTGKKHHIKKKLIFITFIPNVKSKCFESPVISAIYDIKIIIFSENFAIPTFITGQLFVGKSSNKVHFKTDILKLMVMFNKRSWVRLLAIS